MHTASCCTIVRNSVCPRHCPCNCLVYNPLPTFLLLFASLFGLDQVLQVSWLLPRIHGRSIRQLHYTSLYISELYTYLIPPNVFVSNHVRGIISPSLCFYLTLSFPWLPDLVKSHTFGVTIFTTFLSSFSFNTSNPLFGSTSSYISNKSNYV